MASLRQLSVNFARATGNYRSIVNFGVNDVTKNKHMSLYVKEYVDLYHKFGVVQRKPIFKSDYQKLPTDIFNWLLSVHKLQPVSFYSKLRLDLNEFLTEHHKQLEFCHKIQPKLPNINMEKAIQEYYAFLVMCKDNPKQTVIPTLGEDFVWHSHMQENEAYIKDTIQIFGHILDHRTDLEMERIKPESDKIREKTLTKTKDKNNTQTSNCSACTYYYPNYYSPYSPYHSQSHSPYYSNMSVPIPIPFPYPSSHEKESDDKQNSSNMDYGASGQGSIDTITPVHTIDNGYHSHSVDNSHHSSIDTSVSDAGSSASSCGGSSCGGGGCGGGGCSS